MSHQGFISPVQHDRRAAEPLPARPTSSRRPRTRDFPYFTTWVRQQVVDQVGAPARLRGRPQRQDHDRLHAAGGRGEGGQQSTASPAGPAAPLVALDNRTGRSRDGPAATRSTTQRPFNLATQGQRQPGSAFKPFILAEALKEGYAPDVAVHLQEEGVLRDPAQGRQVQRVVRGQQLRGHLRRRRRRSPNATDVLRQLGLRRARHQGRHEEDRPAGAPDGRPHARSRPTRR